MAQHANGRIARERASGAGRAAKAMKGKGGSGGWRGDLSIAVPVLRYNQGVRTACRVGGHEAAIGIGVVAINWSSRSVFLFRSIWDTNFRG